MCLVGTESRGVPPGLGVGPSCLAGAEVGGQGAHGVPKVSDLEIGAI